MLKRLSSSFTSLSPLRASAEGIESLDVNAVQASKHAVTNWKIIKVIHSLLSSPFSRYIFYLINQNIIISILLHELLNLSLFVPLLSHHPFLSLFIYTGYRIHCSFLILYFLSVYLSIYIHNTHPPSLSLYMILYTPFFY